MKFNGNPKQNLFGMVAIIIICVSVSHAATFEVSNTNDSGPGSLRAAIAGVNADIINGTTHQIVFSSLFDTPQTIAISSGIYVDYGTRVEIIGRGNHTTTLTTDPMGELTGVLDINSNIARVYNLRFADAQNLGGYGGAIASNDAGALTIENCVFENNSANAGGAVFNISNASVQIKDSSFFNNSAGVGGAVSLAGYNHVITGSTFSGNQAGSGAAIELGGIGDFTNSAITNCTFSGNSSSDGSILFHGQGSGFLDITNITVANNTAGPIATTGAVFSGSILPNRTNLTNSIVSLNSSGNISGLVNLSASNLIGPDPMLGILAYNGGETPTRALLPGSPAIGMATGVGAPSTDQRGAAFAGDLGAYQSGTVVTSANTLPGSPVTTPIIPVTVTFSSVTMPGTTTQIPINPATAGTLPGGFSLGNGNPAYQINSTAGYTGPLVVCIQVSPATTFAVFNTMRILHNEGGALFDRTILPPASPAPNFATKTICARVSSLSPFVVAESLAPSAANVSVSGRVLALNGRGLANSFVILTDSSGNTRSTRSNSFGYYRIDGIEAGQTVIIGVRSKRFQFEPRVMTLDEDLANLNFYPLESSKY